VYSDTIVQAYVENRSKYSETDGDLFSSLEKLGGVNGKEVLDFGCGQGKHAFEILRLGAKQVVGVDISEEMIKVASRGLDQLEALEAEAKEKINFICADGSRVPLGNNSVDLVFSNFVLHYFTNFNSVFSEINRLLRAGGYFVGTFNICDVGSGYEFLFNQQMPIKLGGSVVVQNLIKSPQELSQAILKNDFEVFFSKELEHPTARIDDLFEYRDKVRKKALLLVLRKKV